MKEGKLIFIWNDISIALSIYVIAVSLAGIWGVDRGMSLMGIFRAFAMMLIAVVCMQCREEERRKLRGMLGWIGCGMVLFCAVAYLIPDMREYFWQAKRLGGTFQYSNTCALFFLIGLLEDGSRVEGVWKEKRNLIIIVKLLILSVGIMLTGSRTTALLMLAAYIYLAIKKRMLRVPVFVLAAGLVIVGGGYAFISGNYQNIGRFLTISASSSTFLGRLLYWKDGLKMIVKHPFGSGYMGYSYLQQAMQTGVYSTRYVHNDLLQIGLDAGVIPVIVCMVVMVRQLFCKKSDTSMRFILLIVILHALTDFDLQYLSMVFVLFLYVSWKNGKEIMVEKSVGKHRYGILFTGGILAVLCMYFGVSMNCNYMEKYEVSLAMYPWQTQILTEQLYACGDMEDAQVLADQILKQNVYVAVAYDAKALAAAMEEDYEAMVTYKEKALDCSKYDLAEYVDYLNLLRQSLEYYRKSNDYEKFEKNCKIMKEMPLRLQRVKEETDSLAWKIKDKPQLDLPKEIKEYLEKL